MQWLLKERWKYELKSTIYGDIIVDNRNETESSPVKFYRSFFSCTSGRFAFFFAYKQFVVPTTSPGIDGDRVSNRFATTWSDCRRSADGLRIRVANGTARQSVSPDAFKNGWHDMRTITNPSTSHFNRGIRRDRCCSSESPRAEMAYSW